MNKEIITFIKIDGWGEMKLEYLVDTVRQLKGNGTWTFGKWKRTPALNEKNGGSSRQYVGQNYDLKYFDLVQDGWTHDHCEICSKIISDTEDSDTKGYNLDNDWICEECYKLFMVTDDIEMELGKYQRVEK
jgi:hypothetical protein